MIMVFKIFVDIFNYFTILSILLFFSEYKHKPNVVRIIASSLSFCVFAVGSYISQSISGLFGYLLPILIYFVKYLVPLLIALGKLGTKVIYTIAMVDFSAVFLNYIIVGFVFRTQENDRDILSSIISILIYMVILTLIWTNKKTANLNKVKVMLQTIPKHIYILLLCTIIILGTLTVTNNYQTENFKLKAIVINIIILILTLVLTSLLVSLFINVVAKQHFSNTTSMLERQVEIQIRHYNKLEKLNNEMRAFRHDYTNHLHSILSLIKMGEHKDAEEYIDKLLRKKEKHQTMFSTGNRLADAILTDKSDILHDNIEINYQGIIPSALDNLDLCTILSNSLDNAIEACNQISSKDSITINAQERQGYFVLTIRNPTIDSRSYTNIPVTSKSDSQNHGMGLLNIQHVVQKYDGQMKIKCQNNIFELSLVLKM